MTEVLYDWHNKDIGPMDDESKSVPFSWQELVFKTHKNKQDLFIDDVSKIQNEDSFKSFLERQKIKSTLLVPLYSEGSLYGLIGFNSI
jgi:GAF domain-containing protein